MPPKAKNEIYELCGISVLTDVSPVEQAALFAEAMGQWARAPAEKKAEAIEAYVKSQEEG